MKIQEAIKSGKPFKRTEETASMNQWRVVYNGFSLAYLREVERGDVQVYPHLSAVDILADDWEVKEEAK